MDEKAMRRKLRDLRMNVTKLRKDVAILKEKVRHLESIHQPVISTADGMRINPEWERH